MATARRPSDNVRSCMRWLAQRGWRPEFKEELGRATWRDPQSPAECLFEDACVVESNRLGRQIVALQLIAAR